MINFILCENFGSSLCFGSSVESSYCIYIYLTLCIISCVPVCTITVPLDAAGVVT